MHMASQFIRPDRARLLMSQCPEAINKMADIIAGRSRLGHGHVRVKSEDLCVDRQILGKVADIVQKHGYFVQMDENEMLVVWDEAHIREIKRANRNKDRKGQ